MFFKKKTKTQTQATAEPSINKEELLQNAKFLIRELEGKAGDERISTLENIGLCYSEAQEYEPAIAYLEKSMHEKKTIGKGYTELLKIYNIKRREAAVAKNDEQLQYYLKKIDEMMAISKEVIRSNL